MTIRSTHCKIKYFLESLGNDGLNKLLYPYADKSAEAVCTFAFSAGPAMEPMIFQGRLQVCLSIDLREIEASS